MEFLLVLVVLFWVVPILLAMNIWGNKGGGKGAGFAMGFFLGWIGVLIAALATPSKGGANKKQLANSRECPHCKSAINRSASVCPHCQRESAPWVFHEGKWWTKHDGKDYYSDGVTGQWTEHKPQLPSSNTPTSAP